MYECMSETPKHVCMSETSMRVCMYVCLKHTYIHSYVSNIHTYIHSQIFLLNQVFSVHGFVQKRSACHENETYIHA